jgi:hypothetical protein
MPTVPSLLAKVRTPGMASTNQRCGKSEPRLTMHVRRGFEQCTITQKP